MVVVYRNTRTGRIVYMTAPVPAMDRSARWERADDLSDAGRAAPAAPVLSWPDPAPDPAGPFDPAEHTVAQVNAYLADADEDERARVLAAEADGRARRGIVEGPHSGE